MSEYCQCENPESEEMEKGYWVCLACNKDIDMPEPIEYEPDLTDEEVKSLDNER